MVIGAGLGGLIAAAKLAKEGKRVLVLEKHARPGGCATTYRRKDYEVEVSLHILDGLDDIDLKRTIFEDFGVFDHIDFVPLPEVFRFVQGDTEVVLPLGLEAAIETLSERYPEDRKQIRAVFQTMSKVRQDIASFGLSRGEAYAKFALFPLFFPHYCFGLRGTLGDYMDRRFKNRELKLIATANLSFFHDDPYTISAKFFGIAMAAFLEGSHYIRGGSQRLSNYLRDFIESKGGEVRLRHQATRIRVEGGKAVAVEYRNGTSSGDVPARHVIANAAVPHVMEKLLGPGVDPTLESRLEDMEVGCSILALHVGFKRPLRELGHRHYTSIVYDESIHTLSDIGPNFRGPYESRAFGFTDYGQIDSNLAPEGKNLGALCTLDYMDAWKGLSKDAYKDKKRRVADVFLARLERLIPGCRNEIEFFELGTPRTVEKYTFNTAGSFGGFSQPPHQAMMRRFFRVRPSIKNLHFASAWQFPGGGYTCAMLSGYLQAINVLENGRI